jgi:hypothetical protein
LAMEITGGGAAPLIKDANVLQLEKAGTLSWLVVMFSRFSYESY